MPIADTVLSEGTEIYNVTVSVDAKSSVNMNGTYDGIRVALRVGSADYKDPAIDELDTNFRTYSHSWAVNPATGSAWTWADIASIEAGAMTAKTKKSTYTTFRVDRIQVTVTWGPENENVPPAVSNVTFTGTLKVGETLTGSYTYTDADGDAEGTSAFQWYRAESPTDTLRAAISGATGLAYTLAPTGTGARAAARLPVR